MIDIQDLQVISVNTDDVILTQHVLERIRQRDAERDDLFNIIMSGEIIEQYPNDYLFPAV